MITNPQQYAAALRNPRVGFAATPPPVIDRFPNNGTGMPAPARVPEVYRPPMGQAMPMPAMGMPANPSPMGFAPTPNLPPRPQAPTRMPIPKPSIPVPMGGGGFVPMPNDGRRY